jgi:DNA recombination protein RmuC
MRCAKLKRYAVNLLTFLAGFVLAAVVALAAVVVIRHARPDPSERPPVTPPDRTPDLGPPLLEAIGRIETQLREFESRERHMLGALDANLASVGRDTAGLAQAMRGTNARGRWGELTLRRVAELAGMSPHCDFVEQVSGGGESRLRPDMLVRLPGGRTLAVDAKTPLSAYLDAESATDAAGKQAALDRHAQQLWRHVGVLASREYWTQFDTAPEMVVLFLPGEHFLGAALERDRDLLERALEKKILIATPVSLVSVLKGAAFGWRERRLAENAEELRRIAGEFHERLRGFAEFYADAGRNLARAVEAYNRSAGSWEARLLPSLKRVRELGVGSSVETPQPQRIDAPVREPRTLEAGMPKDPPRMDPRV